MDFIEIIEMKVPMSSGPWQSTAHHHILANQTICLQKSVYTKEEKADKAQIKINTDNVITAIKKVKLNSISDFYDAFVKRTAAECYEEFMAPQRSSKWHLARQYAITASNFGAAVGHNAYCSPSQCVIEKLWSSFSGNEYTEYGSFHENDARDSFLEALKTMGPTLEDIYPGYTDYKLHETGILKHPECPWMAVSPDGLLQLKGPNGSKWAVVEYKCPARLRDSVKHPYARNNNVPAYYMDQIQGICGLLNEYPDILQMIAQSTQCGIEDIFFIVWQPHQYHITRLKFDRDYYFNSLKPALESWYFKQYLPMAFLKYNDELELNSLIVKNEM